MADSRAHTLESILTLAHSEPDAKHDAASTRAAPVCPLTLVEDTITCAADFLLLQAIATFLERNRTAAPAAAPASASPALQPAVVLCTFKQSAMHYTHIARKWVSLGMRSIGGAATPGEAGRRGGSGTRS